MQSKQKHGEPQIISDYKTMIFKLVHRPKLREDQKIAKLEELAKKFATGWPFKNTELLSGYGGEMGYKNVLEKITRTILDQKAQMALAENEKKFYKKKKNNKDSAKVVSKVVINKKENN
jgi:hypothetical protein